LRLANATLSELGLPANLCRDDVRVITADPNPYGVAAPETIAAMRLLARSEGIVADPVYEGKAVRGLIALIGSGTFGPKDRVLLLHLGGTPAVHAYADQLWEGSFRDLPRRAVPTTRRRRDPAS
jgi:1-aminocyclopropane-1-carboxylate deaminase/D-cysteine desulfhydrase-like pyridoxal-dependent ACC family enzyme